MYKNKYQIKKEFEEITDTSCHIHIEGYAEYLENKILQIQEKSNTVVMPDVYGIFKHESDKLYGYYWNLEVAESICDGMEGEDYYVAELCVDQQ